MSLISLSFYVTPFEITPSHPQYAGVQGSHEAVEVVFELDERLYADSYLYRLEYMDGAGASDTSDQLKPVLQESTGRYLIQSLLPDGWTQSGGGATIRVVIVRLNEMGHEEMVFYSLPARVYFSSREEEGEMKPLRHGLSALIADVHKAGERAEKAAGSAKEALSRVSDATDEANAARDAANTAAGNAGAAAGNAHQAAEAATSAAAMAVTSSDGANLAASTANQAASAAQSAASAANTAAGTANTAAGAANTAASGANVAAKAANDAADAANRAVENIGEKAIPYIEPVLDYAGDNSYEVTGTPVTGTKGEAFRVGFAETWQASGTAPKYALYYSGQYYPILPAGTYPAGAYILIYDGEAFQIQADMRCVEERVEQAEQAANEAVGTYAAEIRQTYQPAFKRTASGTNITAADAAGGADLSRLTLKGRTVVSGTPSPDAPVTITGVKPQTVAVTGKNLLPYREQTSEVTSRGITMKDNADGTYTFNGTADGSDIVFFRIELPLVLSSGWYTLNPQGMKTDNSCLTTIYKAPTYYTAKGNQPLTFYPDESKGPFALGFQFASDTVLENVTVKPMLTYGQESFGFEPYHGQRITADEAELYGDAHAAGKNLIPTFKGTASVNGVTGKLNADGSVTFNGTATAISYISTPYFQLPAGTYTLSGRAVLPSGVRMIIRDGTAGKETPLLTVSGSVSSATEDIAALPRAWCRIIIDAGTTVSNLTIYPQLETGSAATAYEPYRGMTTALEDGDSLDLATGELVRRWKRLELDGTEAWTASGTNEHGINSFRLWMNAGKASWPVKVYCTHYAEEAILSENAQEAGVYLPAGSDTLFIRDTYSTPEDFKAFLAAQKAAGTPVTVLYKIATSSIQTEAVSGGAHSVAQPDGEMMISALGTRGGTAEAVDTEALYTYQPDMNDVLTRLAEVETQLAALTANQ